MNLLTRMWSGSSSVGCIDADGMKNAWTMNGLMMKNTSAIATASDSAVSATDFAIGPSA